MPIFKKSKAKNKKYSVVTPRKKTINFGDMRYQQYRDQTGLKLYSHLDHNDPVRRANYRRRHRGIKKKDGSKAYLDKESPAYYSYFYLW